LKIPQNFQIRSERAVTASFSTDSAKTQLIPKVRKTISKTDKVWLKTATLFIGKLFN